MHTSGGTLLTKAEGKKETAEIDGATAVPTVQC
jgi:hypothetical protein